MLTNIISIGNSKGIRIPKALLELSGLGNKVELKVKKGEITVVPAKEATSEVNDAMLLSEKTLETDWNRPEEEEAWESLQ
jgi:antitoxin MazE